MSLETPRNSLASPSRSHLALLAILLIWSATAVFVVRKLYAEGVEPVTAPPLYRYVSPQVVEAQPSPKPKKKWKAPRLGVNRAAVTSPNQATNPTPPEAAQAAVESNAPLPAANSAASQLTRSGGNISDGTGTLFGTEEVTAYSEQGTGVETKWRVMPHFRFSVVYDSNPFLGAPGSRSDVITTLAPGISFRLGSDTSQLYLFADYTAGIVLFANNSSADSLDHSAKVNFRWRMPKLTVGVNLGFESVTGSNIDLGERVRRQTYYAGITSSYAYSDKISFDLNADFTLPNYSNQAYLDSWETRVQGFVNYQVSEKLQLGIGSTIGFVDVTSGGSQTYEQGLLRVIYAASEKLAFNASAGVETRQTNDGDDFSPVFSLGLVYKPFDGTTVSIDGRRRTYASAALAGQNYEATGVVVSVRQRFLQKFYLSLAAGFERSDYVAAVSGVTANRTDDYYFIRPSFDWDINEHLSLGLFYEHDENMSSGIGARSFDHDLAGVQGTVRF